jgi:hypothetical protein
MAESARSDTRAMTAGGNRDLDALAFASDPGHADTIDRANVLACGRHRAADRYRDITGSRTRPAPRWARTMT